MLKYKEIGIDLGSSNIKIAMVDKTGSSPTASLNPSLNKLGKHEVYPVNCTPYTPEYYQLLKSCIKDFAKKNKLFKISLNIAVPLDNVNSHVSFINMPMVGEKLLEDGVGFEAEQKMAIEGITDSHFTWKAINNQESSEEYEILLTTLKKDIVKALAQFKTIKWKINRVMLQPVILERVVEDNDIIIDLGHELTRVYLYTEGKLSQVEIIEFGGKNILEDIEKHLEDNFINNVDPKDIIKLTPVYSEALADISEKTELSKENFEDFDIFEEEIHDEDSDESLECLEEEVYDENLEEEKIKETFEKDMVSESEDEEVEYDPALIKELSLAIDVKINRIIDEIKRIVRMFELQNGSSVDAVYCIGQLSNLPFLKESMEAELEIELKPVEILDISEEKDNVTLYTIASLVSMDANLKDNTNFSKFIKANVDYTSIIVILLAVSLSVGISFKVISDNYTEKISELQNVESTQMNTISGLQNAIDDVQKSIDQGKNFIHRMDMLKAQKKWLSDILYVIPNKTPLTIVIKDMQIIDGEVVLEGYASDYSSIGFFAKELESIADVKIDSIIAYDGGEPIYSVIMDDPELIGDKYIVEQKFKITLTYQDTLLEH